MGMLVVLAVLAFLGFAGWLFVRALRSPDGAGKHGWLIVIPLIVAFGWLIEQMVVGR